MPGHTRMRQPAQGHCRQVHGRRSGCVPVCARQHARQRGCEWVAGLCGGRVHVELQWQHSHVGNLLLEWQQSHVGTLLRPWGHRHAQTRDECVCLLLWSRAPAAAQATKAGRCGSSGCIQSVGRQRRTISKSVLCKCVSRDKEGCGVMWSGVEGGGCELQGGARKPIPPLLQERKLFSLEALCPKMLSCPSSQREWAWPLHAHSCAAILVCLWCVFHCCHGVLYRGWNALQLLHWHVQLKLPRLPLPSTAAAANLLWGTGRVHALLAWG